MKNKNKTWFRVGVAALVLIVVAVALVLGSGEFFKGSMTRVRRVAPECSRRDTECWKKKIDEVNSSLAVMEYKIDILNRSAVVIKTKIDKLEASVREQGVAVDNANKQVAAAQARVDKATAAGLKDSAASRALTKAQNKLRTATASYMKLKEQFQDLMNELSRLYAQMNDYQQYLKSFRLRLAELQKGYARASGDQDEIIEMPYLETCLQYKKWALNGTLTSYRSVNWTIYDLCKQNQPTLMNLNFSVCMATRQMELQGNLGLSQDDKEKLKYCGVLYPKLMTLAINEQNCRQWKSDAMAGSPEPYDWGVIELCKLMYPYLDITAARCEQYRNWEHEGHLTLMAPGSYREVFEQCKKMFPYVMNQDVAETRCAVMKRWADQGNISPWFFPLLDRCKRVYPGLMGVVIPPSSVYTPPSASVPVFSQALCEQYRAWEKESTLTRNYYISNPSVGLSDMMAKCRYNYPVSMGWGSGSVPPPSVYTPPSASAPAPAGQPSLSVGGSGSVSPPPPAPTPAPAACIVPGKVTKAMFEGTTWELHTFSKTYKVTVEKIYKDQQGNLNAQVMINGDRLAQVFVGKTRSFIDFAKQGNDGTFLVTYGQVGSGAFITFTITEKVFPQCGAGPAETVVTAFASQSMGVYTTNKRYDVTVERIYTEGAGVTGNDMRVTMVINGDRLVGLNWGEERSFGSKHPGDDGYVKVHFVSVRQGQQFVVFTVREK